MKLEAEKVGMCLITGGSRAVNVSFPIVPVTTIHSQEETQIIIHRDFSSLDLNFGEGLPVTFCLDFTNDPTPDQAGWAASLGYYMLRFELVNGKIVSTNPFAIIGKTDGFKNICHRPQRIPYRPTPEFLTEPQLSWNQSRVMKTYPLKGSLWNPFSVISTAVDTSTGSFLTGIQNYDMRCHFEPVLFTEFIVHTSLEEAEKYHNERLKKERGVS